MNIEQKTEKNEVTTFQQLLDGYELRTTAIPLTEAAAIRMRDKVLAKAEALLQEKGSLTSGDLTNLNLFPKQTSKIEKNERTLDSLNWQEREDVFDQIDRLVQAGGDPKKVRRIVFSRRGIIE